jgi:TFIIF-interacting CTD phosphatase-like protein
MQKSVHEREPGVLRTLEQLTECHEKYVQAGAVKEKAKDVSLNVIGKALFDIPINQVTFFPY